MNRKITNVAILCFFISVLIGYYEVQSQEIKATKFKYISPVPGSKYIMPQNNIALRHGDPIQIESLQNFSIQVNGSKSGRISGKIILSDDSRTIIFKPDNSFILGEEISVIVFEGLKTKTGLLLGGEEFSFSVTSVIPDLPPDYFIEKNMRIIRIAASQKRKKQNT